MTTTLKIVDFGGINVTKTLETVDKIHQERVPDSLWHLMECLIVTEDIPVWLDNEESFKERGVTPRSLLAEVDPVQLRKNVRLIAERFYRALAFASVPSLPALDTLVENAMGEFEQLRESTRHAAVAFVDIKDFSGLELLQQKKIINRIRVATENVETKLHGRSEFFNDLAVLTFERNGQPIPREGILNFCRELQTNFRQFKEPTELYIGVHEGHIGVRDPIENGDIARNQGLKHFGSVYNYAHRLSLQGQPEQIVVSEKFLEGMERDKQNLPNSLQTQDRLSDAKNNYSTLVRRGKLIGYRFWGAPHTERIEPQRNAALDEMILEELRIIGTMISEHARKSDPDLDLGLRISLFEPVAKNRRGNGQLSCTKYRVGPSGESLPQGKTTYRYSRTAEGCSGIVGRSYGLEQVEILHKLPDFNTNRDEYVKRLSELNVTPEEATDFGRHARAFLAFPCQLRGQPLDTVVCIDCENPLEMYSFEELRELAKLLQMKRAAHVSAIWQLRQWNPSLGPKS